MQRAYFGQMAVDEINTFLFSVNGFWLNKHCAYIHLRYMQQKKKLISLIQLKFFRFALIKIIVIFLD